MLAPWRDGQGTARSGSSAQPCWWARSRPSSPIGQALHFGQPVAIGWCAILHFLPDADDPAGTVACLSDAVAPGSYLSIRL